MKLSQKWCWLSNTEDVSRMHKQNRNKITDTIVNKMLRVTPNTLQRPIETPPMTKNTPVQFQLLKKEQNFSSANDG